ncbi:hypothetical protein [Acaryochloris marina]|uniref:hypothetical protein n=1 Tax=Acaryochloris marina TaxID=155978 RepID=UPI0021C49EDC|nr:hypothetical protein [Acaryochloris marina]BDM83596.1 hypothetical protein AM10699_64570 [Acaryochloris marina MBIC10699]
MNRKIFVLAAIASSLLFTKPALANDSAISDTLRPKIPAHGQITKVITNDDYALVRWVADPIGGMATLKWTGQSWEVLSTDTRGWPPIEIFAKERGMTIEEAEELLDAYDPNWRQW